MVVEWWFKRMLMGLLQDESNQVGARGGGMGKTCWKRSFPAEELLVMQQSDVGSTTSRQ